MTRTPERFDRSSVATIMVSMETSPAAPNWEDVASRLRRQLLIERAAIALVFAVLLFRWGYVYFTSSSCVILADGQPIVVVESSRMANELLDEVRNSAGGDPKDAEFAQKVETRRRATRAPMDRESALAILKTKLRVLTDKWAILVNKRPYTAVDTKEQAGEVLELARQRYGKLAPNLAEEPSFKEDVTPQLQKADTRIWRRTPQEAVELLFAPDGKVSVHVVKSGEVAGAIASKYSMKLSDMAKLNPGRSLDRLQIGDRLRVGVGKTPLTVIVRNQIARTEPMPYRTESITSTQMYAGKTITLSPGRTGKRQVKVAVTYENGVETGREVVEEVILRPPVPRRIAVGVKPRR
jgi:LysM repeat protein